MTEGAGTVPLTDGEAEKACGPRASSGRLLSTWADEVSGSLTQGVPELPTCSSSPSIAAHVWHVVRVLLPMFGGTHIFIIISVDCYLKMKN